MSEWGRTERSLVYLSDGGSRRDCAKSDQPDSDLVFDIGPAHGVWLVAALVAIFCC